MPEILQQQIQLGDTAPDFIAETTKGKISFHEWLGSKWCILFSHPKDFTPVCTTELGYAAKISPEFGKRNVKLLAISEGSVSTHAEWVMDINKTQNVSLDFPIIGDEDHKVAELYGMIHPKASDTVTVRSVFVIDPRKIVRLLITYPASTGRNFDEILRVLDSLQMTDTFKVATPVNWKPGGECVILPSITNPDEIKKLFPKGYREVTPYLRMTPDPTK